MKHIGNDMIQKLYEAGAITTDPRYVRRVVIDIPPPGIFGELMLMVDIVPYSEYFIFDEPVIPLLEEILYSK